jgi:hypothetical protein
MVIAAIPKRFTYEEIMRISYACHEQASDYVQDMFKAARINDVEGFNYARRAFHRAMTRADVLALAAAKHAANAAIDAAQASISSSSGVSHEQH